MFDFLSVKKTLGDAAGELRALQQNGSELRAQLAMFDASMAAKSDVKAALDGWVDDMGRGLTESVRSMVGELIHSPRDLVNGRRVASVLSLVGKQSSRDEPAAVQIDRLLCGLFSTDVKRVLSDAVDGMAWTNGLPLAQRAAARGQISSALDKVNADEAALRAAAKDAGVTL